jgi:phosphopantothenoylcysteine synthetase/decarboxylase
MRDDALSVIVSGASMSHFVSAYLVKIRKEIDLPLRVLLTYSAERFLQAGAVSFFCDELYTSSAPELNPIEFARRARALVVLPASGNLVASAALGLAGGAAQTALLASAQPALFFPSMTPTMWEKPSMRRHIDTLRADGHRVVDLVETEAYELSLRETSVSLAMVDSSTAAKIITDWLDRE